jgi:hypothetical protein
LYRISNLENSAEEFTQNAAHRNKMKKTYENPRKKDGREFKAPKCIYLIGVSEEES